MHQKESMRSYKKCCCSNTLRAGSHNTDRETGCCFSDLLYAAAGSLDEIRSIKIAHIHLDDPKPYISFLFPCERTE